MYTDLPRGRLETQRFLTNKLINPRLSLNLNPAFKMEQAQAPKRKGRKRKKSYLPYARQYYNQHTAPRNNQPSNHNNHHNQLNQQQNQQNPLNQQQKKQHKHHNNYSNQQRSQPQSQQRNKQPNTQYNKQRSNLPIQLNHDHSQQWDDQYESAFHNNYQQQPNPHTNQPHSNQPHSNQPHSNQPHSMPSHSNQKQQASPRRKEQEQASAALRSIPTNPSIDQIDQMPEPNHDEAFSQPQLTSSEQEQPKLTNQPPLENWTPEKWKAALQFFSNTSFALNNLQKRALAQEIEMEETEVLQGWRHYKKQTRQQKYRSVRNDPTASVQKQRAEEQSQYMLSKVEQMIAKDGTITVTEIARVLVEEMRKDGRQELIRLVNLNRLEKLLRRAGYFRRKIAPTGREANTRQNTARREEFCRYLQTLLAHHLPIYYYHETELGRYKYRNRGWARDGQRIQTRGFVDKRVTLRCLLSPQGIATWRLTYQPTSRQQLQELINELKRIDPGYHKQGRKFLMLDKRAICNRDEFCQAAEGNDFDLISMPAASIILNPINRWFKKINLELTKCEYYNTREDLMKKCECLLLRFNKNSLNWLLQYLPQEIQNCLPLP